MSKGITTLQLEHCQPEQQKMHTDNAILRPSSACNGTAAFKSHLVCQCVQRICAASQVRYSEQPHWNVDSGTAIGMRTFT